MFINIEPIVDKKKIFLFFQDLNLQDYKRYIKNLENNPYLTLIALFDEGFKNKGFFDFNFNFKKYIVDTIEKIIDENYGEIGAKMLLEIFIIS